MDGVTPTPPGAISEERVRDIMIVLSQRGCLGYNDELAVCQALLSARAELAEQDTLFTRMRDLLTRTANALKGEPDDLSMHDWSDLPKVAAEIRLSRDLLQAASVETALIRDVESLRASLASSEAEKGRMRAALADLIDMADHFHRQGAFSNGNTAPGGTIDEGDVLSMRVIDQARAALAPAQEKKA